jgi:predicted dienelactone hydrolase
MRTLRSDLIRAFAAMATLLVGAGAHAAGFQQGVAADPGRPPLVIGIWYPSRSDAKPVSMGPTTMTVAIDAPVAGTGLPMVMMSHGAGSSFLAHFDTAIALADAGFVVVAVNHAGDNYADRSRSADIMDRPRQVARVLDHMLSTWNGRAALDPQRIGMFGYSAGGATTLSIIGGVADLAKIAPMCREHPADYVCQLLANGTSPAAAAAAATAATAPADARVKAAVIAAPAIGFAFAPDGLKDVTVPVQLWRAEHDALVPHPRYAEAVRAALPSAPDYRVVANAGHYDFMAPCSDAMASIAASICGSPAGFDRAAFHVDFDAAIVAFFERTLPKR